VGRGGEGGWRIVIPMPEAINFVDGRRQKFNLCLAMGIKSGEPLNSLGEQLGEAITFF
jgi:hypothetical protein